VDKLRGFVRFWIHYFVYADGEPSGYVFLILLSKIMGAGQGKILTGRMASSAERLAATRLALQQVRNIQRLQEYHQNQFRGGSCGWASRVQTYPIFSDLRSDFFRPTTREPSPIFNT
jgi:hypothetical protein